MGPWTLSESRYEDEIKAKVQVVYLAQPAGPAGWEIVSPRVGRANGLAIYVGTHRQSLQQTPDRLSFIIGLMQNPGITDLPILPLIVQ